MWSIIQMTVLTRKRRDSSYSHCHRYIYHTDLALALLWDNRWPIRFLGLGRRILTWRFLASYWRGFRRSEVSSVAHAPVREFRRLAASSLRICLFHWRPFHWSRRRSTRWGSNAALQELGEPWVARWRRASRRRWSWGRGGWGCPTAGAAPVPPGFGPRDGWSSDSRNAREVCVLISRISVTNILEVVK